MAKLEELSELLVSEIRDFEEAVKRLEEVQKKKIQLDITELQVSLNRHEKNLSTSILELEKQFSELKAAIGKAKLYPKWAVIFFIISVSLNLLGLIILY